MAKLEVHPLMRTIVEYPDADLPRLVYADWLDEQDDPKLAILAEAIRLEIERVSLPPGSPRFDELAARWHELFTRDRTALLPPLPKWAVASVTCERGLPQRLYCTLKRFAEGGARVLDFVPITAVHLAALPDHQAVDAGYAVPSFARPELRRVRKLSVMATLDAPAFVSLCESTAIANLRELEFDLRQLPNEAARVLVRSSERFSRLERLSINSTALVSRKSRTALLEAFGDRFRFKTHPT